MSCAGTVVSSRWLSDGWRIRKATVSQLYAKIAGKNLGRFAGCQMPTIICPALPPVARDTAGMESPTIEVLAATRIFSN